MRTVSTGSCALMASSTSCRDSLPSPSTSTTRHQPLGSCLKSGTGATEAIRWRVSGQRPLPVPSHSRAAARLKKCGETRFPFSSRNTPTGLACSGSKQMGHSACLRAWPSRHAGATISCTAEPARRRRAGGAIAAARAGGEAAGAGAGLLSTGSPIGSDCDGVLGTSTTKIWPGLTPAGMTAWYC
eukprot:scaffold116408_cov29-Tisochrysis_lutea.AAC.3